MERNDHPPGESTGPDSPAAELIAHLDDDESNAAAALLPLVYDDLRAAAAALLRQERPGHTLQPTALVHEAFIRLAGTTQPSWTSRAHFRAIAAKVMRQVLVDHARRRGAQRHGGDLQRVTLDGPLQDELSLPDQLDVLDLHEALERLAALSPRQARVVEMRVMGGLTAAECAHVLGLSVATVNDDWAVARAWLACELRPAT